MKTIAPFPVGALWLRGVGENTKHTASIKNCFFHDFAPNLELPERLITHLETRFSELDVCVEDCVFQNLHGQGASGLTAHICISKFGQTPDESSAVSIKDCRFEEPLENNNEAVLGIFSFIRNDDERLLVKDNVFAAIRTAIQTQRSGSLNSQHTICGNCVSNARCFYDIVFTSSPNILESCVAKNTVMAEIPIFVTAFNDNNTSKMIVERNCFNGSDRAILVSVENTDNTITIDAGGGTLESCGYNNFVGYNADIFTFGPAENEVSIFAQQNWWGQGNPCLTGADCTVTQECQDGICVGPDNIVNNQGALIDVSEALSAPVKCTNKCVCGNSAMINLSEAVSESEIEESIFSSLFARIKNFFS